MVGNNFPFIPISTERIEKVGAESFAAGFPLINLQGHEVKLTKGIISSLTGFQDDPRCYQISAALQPGNSGGPVLNANGELTGIAIAKMDAVKIFKLTGALPENVNYAIKKNYLLILLDSKQKISTALQKRKAKQALNNH